MSVGRFVADEVGGICLQPPSPTLPSASELKIETKMIDSPLEASYRNSPRRARSQSPSALVQRSYYSPRLKEKLKKREGKSKFQHSILMLMFLALDAQKIDSFYIINSNVQ